MTSNVVLFEGGNLPAYLKQAMETRGDAASELAGGIGVGFPVISYRGKEWSINEGGVVEPLVDEDNEPVRSIEVVIVRANPVLSKVFYPGGYVPGSADKPLCYSNDSVAPSPQSAEPQAVKCAVCPHNVWGSKITDNGSKAKACADAKRAAVVFPDEMDKPMLLRIPAASLKDLATYADTLGKRRTPPHAVTTRVGFVQGVAHPQLTFTAKRFATQEEYDAAEELRDSAVVAQIIGLEEVGHDAAPETPAGPAIAGTPPVVRQTEAKPQVVETPTQQAQPPAAQQEEKPATRRPGRRVTRTTEDAPAATTQQATTQADPPAAASKVQITADELDDVLAALDDA